MKRRTFIQQSSMASLALLGRMPKEKLKLSFSTLGCPEWSFDQIVKFAVQHGYSGLEIRGIQKEMDLSKAAPFKSPEALKETLRLMRDNKLVFVNLGASAAMHHAAPATRAKNLDEAKRLTDLAEQLSCPYIRVFPDHFPKDQDREKTIELMVSGLKELGDYANNTSVTVLMETHGDLVYADDIVNVMQLANHKKVALVYDMVNMWRITREAPGVVYPKLKSWIRHAHIKDLNIVEGNKPSYVLLGKGEAPVKETIELLKKGGYKGFYSFEWEKLWHPEIADPEIAIADYVRVMKTL
ncbi:sugar phosphate isomerase/epimerase family protein [Pollutibacter soli]|uniref:sugar phosphate isomerase/epimerase family protein n=1 Tax=Pollutibacter soli TaxID=3034157 RepID=UPI0030140A1E